MEPYSWLYSCLGCAALEWNDPIWAAPWQNQQCGCAPSKDSDQPGHPPSLIRVFAVHMKKAWVLSYPLNAQRRLWSDWAHFVGFVMSWLISICLLYHVFCCCFYWDFTARRNYLTSFEQVGRKWKILKNITETSPYSFGNFRKLSLYNCFMPNLFIRFKCYTTV